MTSEVTEEDLEKVLTYFSTNYYIASNKHPICEEALQNCLELIKLDYSFMTINNDDGVLSVNYPTKIIIIESELQPLNGNANVRTTDTIYENSDSKRNMIEFIHKARLGRCRARFPVPVILYKGKHICRSSTVASESEMLIRRSYESFSGKTPDLRTAYNDDLPDELLNQKDPDPEDNLPVPDDKLTSDLSLYDKVRRADTSYLKSLNVTTIIDLMVERKKVKFNIYVSSSEKVDKDEVYKDFNLLSLPYPGCEFFFDYRHNDYNGTGLVFKWEQTYVDAVLSIPQEMAVQIRVDWDEYKNWDVIVLTQNYMQLMLRHLHESTSGLLIHCISGWDRTPLFISMLRISLWADGVIHQKLTAIQILYFTITYDWMLFGHDLNDRITKGEEIMHFCFHMLKFIADDDYSILLQSPRKSRQSTTTGSTNSVNSESTTTSGGGGSSSSVIRTDSDSQLDGVMFEDTHGSNMSVNSTESLNSNKDPDSLPTVRLDQDEYFNGNPQPLNVCETSPPMPRGSPFSSHQRRTSPVAVPSQFRRHRDDSTSSLTGWLMVTNTGSVRSEFADSSNFAKPDFGSNTMTRADEELSLMRMKRLNEVRGLFQTHYGRVVGSRMNNYESNMKSVISTIAETVGLL